MKKRFWVGFLYLESIQYNLLREVFNQTLKADIRCVLKFIFIYQIQYFVK